MPGFNEVKAENDELRLKLQRALAEIAELKEQLAGKKGHHTPAAHAGEHSRKTVAHETKGG